ncbi:MarR family transcriptional regulator [Natronosalvus halobius]|uniref:MarR family transcriptional regulator n=1 Tax=Natronosalvus halobius TaxID=2953746 RepID=UPI0020A11C26|nr:MarR family transcriptional regulator [Natronosalvus halobius]USZ73320.1 MarR family transcriptional regulator [Natronosalvus halobius]
MTIAVRKQGEWMSKNDERILELLCSTDRCRPRDIRDELNDFGIALRLDYVDKRLETLEDAGLVASDALRFRITDRGRAYLLGEFDATSVRSPQL